MENKQLLEILYRINTCISYGDWVNARDYTRLEIKNLKNITEKDCLNNRYCNDWYCKDCSNLNCNNKKLNSY